MASPALTVAVAVLETDSFGAWMVVVADAVLSFVYGSAIPSVSVPVTVTLSVSTAPSAVAHGTRYWNFGVMVLVLLLVRSGSERWSVVESGSMSVTLMLVAVSGPRSVTATV